MISRAARLRFAGPEVVVGPNHLPGRSKRRLGHTGIQGGAIPVGGWIVVDYDRRHLGHWGLFCPRLGTF